MLFQGRAEISVDVVDVHKFADGPKFQKEYSAEYPSGGWPVPADQSNVSQFRQKFLNLIAQELSWYFIEHDPDEALKISID